MNHTKDTCCNKEYHQKNHENDNAVSWHRCSRKAKIVTVLRNTHADTDITREKILSDSNIHDVEDFPLEPDPENHLNKQCTCQTDSEGF